VATLLASISLAAWLYLLVGRGFFWLARERDDRGIQPILPAPWPSVVAVVPARNEADVIARSLGSLLAQDYPGPFKIILVDDDSDDGTAKAAKALIDRARTLEVMAGAPLPPGWTGKLWAVSQGIARTCADAPPPDFLLLTDADIAHSPDNVRALVERALAGRLVLTSLMARLTVETWAERLLVPAFVFFFAMLCPFAWVNDPRRRTAAAAGGCMLVRRDGLEAAGGIAAISGAIIDDCALAELMKRRGPIWLGLTDRARSLRPYASLPAVGAMVSRSAFAQLRYSPALLAVTVAGMAILYLAPPALALFAGGAARLAGAAAWLAMAVAFLPMLRFYGLGAWRGLLMPLIGALYTAFTLASAVDFWRGRGGMWKGRVQAMAPT
jgi:hopene-associated glycosyltransferase HpnB